MISTCLISTRKKNKYAWNFLLRFLSVPLQTTDSPQTLQTREKWNKFRGHHLIGGGGYFCNIFTIPDVLNEFKSKYHPNYLNILWQGTNKFKILWSIFKLSGLKGLVWLSDIYAFSVWVCLYSLFCLPIFKFRIKAKKTKHPS